MIICQEQYEPGTFTRKATHTCDKPEGHDLPHYCPECGSTWNEPGGPVTPGE
jgi:hypothetical protein